MNYINYLKLNKYFILLLCLVLPLLSIAGTPPIVLANSNNAIKHWTKNTGQVVNQSNEYNSQVKYCRNLGGVTFALTETGHSIQLNKKTGNSVNSNRIDVSYSINNLPFSDGKFLIEGESVLTNRFNPNCSMQWYDKYNNSQKYDILLNGNAAKSFEMIYQGCDKLYTTQAGKELHIVAGQDTIIETMPLVTVNGFRVTCKYSVHQNKVSFQLEHQVSETDQIVIDPWLIWGSYFGGTGEDNYTAVATDNFGNTYLAGNTTSKSTVFTTGAHNTKYSGGSNDGLLTKFNYSGVLVWSTYVGGADEEQLTSLTIDKDGYIYVAGYTASGTGISTSGAYQTSRAGDLDGFIIKFSPTGQREFGTYVGGLSADRISKILYDTAGYVWICGGTRSTSGIATTGSVQPNKKSDFDGFLAKFDLSGRRVLGTYFGTGSYDFIVDMCFGKSNQIFAILNTGFSDSLYKGTVRKAKGKGKTEVVLASFSLSADWNWSTYIGGTSDDEAVGVSVDLQGNILTLINTFSDSLSSNGSKNKGSKDLLVTKFSANAKYAYWSNYIGGSDIESGVGIRNMIHQNSLWVVANTNSSSMTTKNAWQSIFGGQTDALLTQLDSGGQVINESYWGGLGSDLVNTMTIDVFENVVIAGQSSSTSLYSGKVYQSSPNSTGVYDAIYARFRSPRANDAGILNIVNPEQLDCSGKQAITVNLKNYAFKQLDSVNIYTVLDGGSPDKYIWRGKLSADSVLLISLGVKTIKSGYHLLTIYTDFPNGVRDTAWYNDTASIYFTAFSSPDYAEFKDTLVCIGTNMTLGVPNNPSYKYSWSSAPGNRNDTTSYITIKAGGVVRYFLSIKDKKNACEQKLSLLINTRSLPIRPATMNNVTICSGQSISIGYNASLAYSYRWFLPSQGNLGNVALITVKPIITTKYYVEIKDSAKKCTWLDSVTVNVLKSPLSDAGADVQICIGKSFTLNRKAPAKFTYTWYRIFQGSPILENATSVSPQTTTTYRLQVTDSLNSCSSYDSFTIIVTNLPIKTNIPNTFICSGESLAIGGISRANHTYTWTSKPAGFTANNSNPSVSPSVTTKYILIETNTITGCVRIDSTTVLVNKLPAITVGTAKNICKGDFVQIGTSALNGLTYNWVGKQSGYNSTVANPIVQPQLSEWYVLQVTSTGSNCISSDSVFVQVQEAFKPSFIAKANKLNFNFSIASPKTNVTYTWTFGDGYIDTGKSVVHTYAFEGIYKVKVSAIYSLGCAAVDSSNIKASLVAIRNQKSEHLKLTVNPVPFDKFVNINIDLDKSASIAVSLYNTNGHKLRTITYSQLSAGTHHIKWITDDLPAGNYIVECLSELGMTRMQIIKQ